MSAPTADQSSITLSYTSRHQSQDSTADITPVNMADPEPALHHKSTSLRIIKMVAIQNGEPPIESVL